MGISFGSKGAKPYVGSREVKEAYVGNQLVYRATLPYTYAFLGGANSYMLADWASLSATGAAITKEGSNFRVALTGQTNTAGAGTFIMREVRGGIIKFMHKGRGVRVRGDVSAGGLTFATLPARAEWTLESVNVDQSESWRTISIQLNEGNSSASAYLDAIRYEN